MADPGAVCSCACTLVHPVVARAPTPAGRSTAIVAPRAECQIQVLGLDTTSCLSMAYSTPPPTADRRASARRCRSASRWRRPATCRSIHRRRWCSNGNARSPDRRSRHTSQRSKAHPTRARTVENQSIRCRQRFQFAVEMVNAGFATRERQVGGAGGVAHVGPVPVRLDAENEALRTDDCSRPARPLPKLDRRVSVAVDRRGKIASEQAGPAASAAPRRQPRKIIPARAGFVGRSLPNPAGIAADIASAPAEGGRHNRRDRPYLDRNIRRHDRRGTLTQTD